MDDIYFHWAHFSDSEPEICTLVALRPKLSSFTPIYIYSICDLTVCSEGFAHLSFIA